MMAGSHIALGAAAWLAAAPQLGLPATSPSCLGLAVLGSLLPDIDHPKSWVGKRVRPLSNLVGAIFGHRGVTHSLLAIAACGWLATGAQWPAHVTLPLAVGYISHLAADLLTPRGLRLLWPLKGTWALPLCKAGSPFEPLVVALVLTFAWTATETKPDLGKAWREVVSAAAGLLPREALPLHSKGRCPRVVVRNLVESVSKAEVSKTGMVTVNLTIIHHRGPLCLSHSIYDVRGRDAHGSSSKMTMVLLVAEYLK